MPLRLTRRVQRDCREISATGIGDGAIRGADDDRSLELFTRPSLTTSAACTCPEVGNEGGIAISTIGEVAALPAGRVLRNQV